MKSMFTKGLSTAGGAGVDAVAMATKMDAMSATDLGGLYAHNFMANMANTSWGAASLGGAAIGGVVGGVSGGIEGQGILGSAASGAVTGAMFGAGGKLASNIYSKNAHAGGELVGFMSKGAGPKGKYATSFQGSEVQNPFQLGNYIGKPTSAT